MCSSAAGQPEVFPDKSGSLAYWLVGGEVGTAVIVSFAAIPQMRGRISVWLLLRGETKARTGGE